MEKQRLSVKGFMVASAVLWGGAVLMASLANMAWPDYATDFLTVVGSVYPGYEPFNGVSSVLIGSLYAVFDGAVAGAIFAWIYNQFCG